MRAVLILAAVVLVASPTAQAAPNDHLEPELKFANGLRDLGYLDLAVEQFQKLNWPKQQDPKFRLRVAEGLIATHVAASSAADRPTDALRDLRRGVTEITRLLSDKQTKADDLQCNRLLMRQGRMLLEQGRLAIDIHRRGPEGVDPAKVAAKAEAAFDNAINAFTRARDGYKQIVERIEAKTNVSDADRKMRREMLSEQVATETQVGWARFRRAELAKELKNEGVFKTEIQAAMKIFEDLSMAYPDFVAGIDATLGKALCLQELGRHKRAVATLKKVLGTKQKLVGAKRSEAIDMIRFEAYDNKAKSQAALHDYEGAVETLKALRQEFPRLAAGLEETLRMRYARTLGKAADALRAQAEKLAAKGNLKSKRTAKELRTKASGTQKRCRKLYTDAVSEVEPLAASDGPYAQEANLLMGRWAEAGDLKVKHTAANFFAEGEHLLATNRPAEAVIAYRKVIERARDTRPDRKLAHDAWIQMAKAYTEQKMYYEAGLVLGHVARLFEESEQAEKSAVYSAMLLGATYKAERTAFAAEVYLESQQLLADRFPYLKVSQRAAFRLADLRRDQKRYEEAADYYAKIAQASEYYERAGYLRAGCLWEAFLEKTKASRKPVTGHTLTGKAIKQLEPFIAWAEDQPHAPPAVEKARRLWTAAAKVLLGEIYLHENRPKDVLRVLTHKALAGFGKALAEYGKPPPGQEDLVAHARLYRLRAYCAFETLKDTQKAGEEMKTLQKDKRVENRVKSAAARLVGTTFVKLADDLKKKKQRDPRITEKDFPYLCTNAEIYLIRAIKLNTEQTVDDYRQIAADLHAVEAYKQSASVFNMLVQRFKDKPEHADVVRDARRWIGTCQKKAGDWKQAMTVFKALVDEFPRWMDVRRDLAECYGHKQIKRYADAEEQWRSVEEALEARTLSGDEWDDWFQARHHRVETLMQQNDAAKKALAYQLMVSTMVSHPTLGGRTWEQRFTKLIKERFDRKQREELLNLHKEALQPTP